MLQQLLRGGEILGGRASGMSRRLRIAAIVSAVLHICVLVVLLVGLPSMTPKEEPPEETTVAMVFQGTAKSSMLAPTPAQVPAPSKETAPPAPPVPTPSKPQPTEAAPPPPPPPPPPPQAHVEPAPPSPTPPNPTPAAGPDARAGCDSAATRAADSAVAHPDCQTGAAVTPAAAIGAAASGAAQHDVAAERDEKSGT